MNLRHLEHLLALADTGSFSRAAEKSHVTQSALSRSIQALETELGAPLIDRGGGLDAEAIGLGSDGELTGRWSGRLVFSDGSAVALTGNFGGEKP